jgi:hypothetical protein
VSTKLDVERCCKLGTQSCSAKIACRFIFAHDKYVRCSLFRPSFDALSGTPKMPIITARISISCTYGHSQLKTGHPVRSAIHKQLNGRLVLRWVTTWESLLLYVLFFASSSLLSLSGHHLAVSIGSLYTSAPWLITKKRRITWRVPDFLSFWQHIYPP